MSIPLDSLWATETRVREKQRNTQWFGDFLLRQCKQRINWADSHSVTDGAHGGAILFNDVLFRKIRIPGKNGLGGTPRKVPFGLVKANLRLLTSCHSPVLRKLGSIEKEHTLLRQGSSATSGLKTPSQTRNLWALKQKNIWVCLFLGNNTPQKQKGSQDHQEGVSASKRHTHT